MVLPQPRRPVFSTDAEVARGNRRSRIWKRRRLFLADAQTICRWGGVMIACLMIARRPGLRFFVPARRSFPCTYTCLYSLGFLFASSMLVSGMQMAQT